VVLSAVLVAAAAVVVMSYERGLLRGLLEDTLQIQPAASKPVSSFWDFYAQIYRREHSNDGSRLLHVVGTGLVVLQFALTPELFAAFVAAMACGMAAFPFTRGLELGVAEAVVMVGLFLLLAHRGTGSHTPALLVLVSGYAFAWLGHFGVQHNRPATFIYPSYSLASDFLMFYHSLSGAWPLDLTKAVADVQAGLATAL